MTKRGYLKLFFEILDGRCEKEGK